MAFGRINLLPNPMRWVMQSVVLSETEICSAGTGVIKEFTRRASSESVTFIWQPYVQM
jgi:hypothetical protein